MKIFYSFVGSLIGPGGSPIIADSFEGRQEQELHFKLFIEVKVLITRGIPIVETVERELISTKARVTEPG